VLRMHGRTEGLHGRSVRPRPDVIAICLNVSTLGTGLDLVVQGLPGRRRHLAL